MRRGHSPLATHPYPFLSFLRVRATSKYMTVEYMTVEYMTVEYMTVEYTMTVEYYMYYDR